VADDEGRLDATLRPGIPVVDVHVGAADGGGLDFDQHLVGADLRDVHGDHFQARGGTGLADGLHLALHGVYLLVHDRVSEQPPRHEDTKEFCFCGFVPLW